MISFTNGDKLTIEEAVQLLEDEKKLGSSSYYSNGYRNAVGVLENWYFDKNLGFPISRRSLKSIWLSVCLNSYSSKLNDLSPASRCEEMTRYLKEITLSIIN